MLHYGVTKMELKDQLALRGSDEEFIRYLTLSTLTPNEQRLLEIVDSKDAWYNVFDYESPEEVWQELDNARSDLSSAEDMIKEQADEILRLTNRTVIELLADQERKLKMANDLANEARHELDKEIRRRELAEHKIETWNILSN